MKRRRSKRSLHRVRALLLTPEDKVVLIRRTVPGRAPYLTLPGGKVESTDSSLEAALRREVWEEVGGRSYVGDALTTLHIPSPVHFFVARVFSYDPDLRSGPEVENPQGEYAVEEHEVEALSTLPIRPHKVKPLLAQWAIDYSLTPRKRT